VLTLQSAFERLANHCVSGVQLAPSLKQDPLVHLLTPAADDRLHSVYTKTMHAQTLLT
jgi:hypothetical protein